MQPLAGEGGLPTWVKTKYTHRLPANPELNHPPPEKVFLIQRSHKASVTLGFFLNCVPNGGWGW